jgi:hypothetical protein
MRRANKIDGRIARGHSEQAPKRLGTKKGAPLTGRPLKDLRAVARWKNLVTEAHVPYPFVVETLRLRSGDLKLVNCLSTL